MDGRTLFTTIGAGITSALLVAVLLIELLDFEFAAIVGLPIGLLAGVGVAIVFWARGDELSRRSRRAATAYAAFGITVLGLLAVRYVNVGRRVLTFDVVLGSGIAAIVVVYVALGLSERTPS